MSLYQEFTEAFKDDGGKFAEAGYSIIANLASGIVESAPEMIGVGAQIFTEFLSGVSEHMPELVPKAVEIITALARAFINNLPTIISAGISMLKGLIQGIIESLPLLISEVPRIINDFAAAIYSGLGQLVLAGIEMIAALIQGLWDNRGLLLDNAGEIFLAFLNVFSLSKLFSLGKNLVQKLAEGIHGLGSMIANAGRALLQNLVSGIKSLAMQPVTTLKEIALNALNAVRNIDWLSLGNNIVKGIANGLRNGAGAIISAAKDAASSALRAAKDFLGIHSPSTVFRDQVGKMMAAGMGKGFSDNVPTEEMSGKILKSVTFIKDKAAEVTRDTSISIANEAKRQDVVKYVEEDGDEPELRIINVFEVDGTPLVEKTTKATIKRISSDQKKRQRSKGWNNEKVWI